MSLYICQGEKYCVTYKTKCTVHLFVGVSVTHKHARIIRLRDTECPCGLAALSSQPYLIYKAHWVDKTFNAWVAEMVSLMMVKDKTTFQGYCGDFSFLGNQC